MKISDVARVMVFAGLVSALLSSPARAEIVGDLELPDGFASGASNVQGWAYTTTPGARLTPPFAVLIDGVEQFKVACCGDRGDVQAAHPEAPLLTGFATVYNWGLAATAMLPLAHPSGLIGLTRILVQVVVTDDMGGVKVLGKSVDLYHPTSWPRSKLMQWDSDPAPAGLSRAASETAAAAPADVRSECQLTNSGFYTPGGAEIFCTNVAFTAPDDATDTCPALIFSWDRGSQSFKLTSDCLPGPLD